MCILGAVAAWLLTLALAPPPVLPPAPDVVGPAPESSAPDFVWDAPDESCPSEAEVRESLASRSDAAELGVRAEARVRREGQGWSLHLKMVAGDAASERVLSAESCDTLLEAALFSYSLAIERRAEEVAEAEEREQEERELEPVPVVSEPPATEELEPLPAPIEDFEAVEDRPRRRKGPPLDFVLRAHAGAGQGALGLGTAPIGGSLGLGGARWRAELGGGAYIPREVTLTQPDTAGARLSAWMLRGRGCGVLPLGHRLILPLCGQLEGGLLRASGFGVNSPAQPQSPHLTASGVVAAGLLLGRRVRLWLDLQGGVSVVRAGFSIDNATETLFRAPVGTFGAELGVEVRFGAV